MSLSSPRHARIDKGGTLEEDADLKNNVEEHHISNEHEARTRTPSIVDTKSIEYNERSTEEDTNHSIKKSTETNEEKRNPSRRNTLRVLSGFWIAFMIGWGEGVTGVVLPYLKQQFELTYTLSALIFVATSSGFIVATFTLELFTNYFGRFPLSSEHRLSFPPIHLSIFSYSFYCIRYLLACVRDPERHGWLAPKAIGFSLAQGRHFLLVLAAFIHILFFITTSNSPTFAGVVIGFFMSGLAKAYMMSSMNTYMVSHPHKTFGLGHLHSFYCVGALTAPLLCQTSIAKHEPWQRFYLYSIALAFANILSVTLSFRPTREEFLKDKGNCQGVQSKQGIRRQEERGTVPARDLEEAYPRVSAVPDEKNEDKDDQLHQHNLPQTTFMAAVKTPDVWAFGFFISLYAGSEGTTNGYIVTYLLKMRDGDPARVGYANSAFWAGSAVGRMLLGYTSPRMGRFKPYWMLFFLACALVLHVCIWMIPSFIAGWVLTAFVGLSMGPVFPFTLGIASQVVSPAIMGNALALITAMANMGGAIYPFLTGLLSNVKGERVIEPVIVALFATMICFWTFNKLKFIRRDMMEDVPMGNSENAKEKVEGTK
ncbi:MFS general substrate transporter [Serendipita vermifera]|nr:MFS general substrate transporter [Serendipita vermifera]